MDGLSVALLIFVFLWLGALIWALYLYNKIQELKSEFKKIKFYHNSFISLYIIVARENRELVKRYNSFRAGVRDTFFSQIMSTQEVIDFFNRCDIPQGDAKENESNKTLIENNIKDGRAKTRNWNELFSDKN